MIKFTWKENPSVHPKALHRAFCEAGGKDIGQYDFSPAEGWHLTVNEADGSVVKEVLESLDIPFTKKEVRSRFK